MAAPLSSWIFLALCVVGFGWTVTAVVRADRLGRGNMFWFLSGWLTGEIALFHWLGVAVTGGSAGGHLVTWVASTANDPRLQPGFEAVDTPEAAAVPFYGISYFTDRHSLKGSGAAVRRSAGLAAALSQIPKLLIAWGPGAAHGVQHAVARRRRAAQRWRLPAGPFRPSSDASIMEGAQ